MYDMLNPKQYIVRFTVDHQTISLLLCLPVFYYINMGSKDDSVGSYVQILFAQLHDYLLSITQWQMLFQLTGLQYLVNMLNSQALRLPSMKGFQQAEQTTVEQEYHLNHHNLSCLCNDKFVYASLDLQSTVSGIFNMCLPQAQWQQEM